MSKVVCPGVRARDPIRADGRGLLDNGERSADRTADGGVRPPNA